ncbi:MAG: aminotransferase class V-fold PLP-dependent enzyme [Gemmatimonadetes bacterium]|nr:aminotransferase class V-fold PLP-dependent enzyme [Gemmatimonadota bacterium]
MGPLSKRVVAAGDAGIRHKCAPHQIQPRDFFADGETARRRFATLIGADDASRVAIIPAVSYGIATVARNEACRPGQTIVIAEEQFPSNVHAWRRFALRTGAELRTVAPPASARRGEAWNAAILEAIDARTVIVALPQVHWTDGTRFDLVAIGAAARAAGAAFIIDATQSVGALPFDLHAIGADAVVCAAYKWLLGPYSIGLAWFGLRYAAGEPLEETWIGREGSEDFRGLVRYRDEYQPGAARFDVGEWSNFILLPMLVAALEQVGAWGAQRIQDYCARLMLHAIEEARTMGFTVEEPEWRGSHLFGMRTPPGLDLAELQASLDRRGVSVSLRGSAMRVSPNVYNDEADVRALLEVLRDRTLRARR